jgi:predicted acyl esterase
VGQSEASFPPPDVSRRELFLDAHTGTLLLAPPAAPGHAEYDPQGAQPHIDFTFRFETDTEVIGRPIVQFDISVDGTDDANVYLYLQKLDRRGRQMWHQAVDLGLPLGLGRILMPIAQRRGVKAVGNAFYGGSHGMLRVSRRGLDAGRHPDDPELSLRSEQKLTAGETVTVEVPCWPTAMRWHAGESLRLRISGICLLPETHPGVHDGLFQPGARHLIHTGGTNPAHISLAMRTAKRNAE